MITDQQFIELLEKFHSGRCTEQEIAEIDNYLENRKDDSVAPQTHSNEQLLASAWSKIQESVHKFDKFNTRRQYKFQNLLKAVAAIVIVSGLSLLIYHSRLSIYNTLVPETFTVVSANNSEHAQVLLADGSTVVLNEKSKLRYSNRYNKQLREVTLIGEAFFEVIKDKKKPFIVHTKNLNTRVLGTSFNVDARPQAENIRVALVTGKVWVTVNQQGSKVKNIILTPNQTLSYNLIKNNFIRSAVTDAHNYTAWKDGKLHFTNTNLMEALERIGNTYGVRVVLQDQNLVVNRIYGVFHINEKPENVLNNICKLIGAKCVLTSSNNFSIVSIKNH